MGAFLSQAMAKTSPPSSRRRKRSVMRRNAAGSRGRSLWARVRAPLLALLLVGLGAGLTWLVWLDVQIRDRFEGQRWAVPARVFARPLVIEPGAWLRPEHLVETLRLLRYRKVARVREPGEYRRAGDTVYLYTRGFPFPADTAPELLARVDFADGRVVRLREALTGRALELVRVEPVPIASIYPASREDRILVRLADVPELLIQALLVVEDRHFYTHHGLDPMAVLRAAWANLRAGRTVQGGSTLTQQLVKNYFLSNERTLRRKLNEAAMALLLEAHYDKDEILEAYLNEVYLGQDGRRAIHGFALGAQFYFARRLGQLKPEQIALLVGLIKGPSYYNPRRHPQRARARRDLVLTLLEREGVLSAREAAEARGRPLGVTAKAPGGSTPYPAFIQLVREQLHRDYREEDLRGEGLMVFTTLDPLLQHRAERAVTQRLKALERARGIEAGTLEAAVVVMQPRSGDVLALVGGRRPGYAGFNRALQARRPVGSLIKPAVYLTALEEPAHYTLATLLDDTPFTVQLGGGKRWSPRNYDRKGHGRVLLIDALARSYNVATARLGLDLGLRRVVRTLQRLGLERRVDPFPSLVLGAVDLTPLEVARLYQPLASGGLAPEPRAVLAVAGPDGRLDRRYALKIRRVAEPVPVYLVETAMQEVVRTGTA
ncbi:MAG TPA: penicillin-binding protein 1B, partial [Chromatiales bacterium]|nr:penicillin-binding protein 1B [Chromatiales bacterium]